MAQGLCEVCGEPMPEGEEMFKFHGYSGPCPKPPLPRPPAQVTEQELAAKAKGPRVTEAQLKALVQEAVYHRFGGTTTTTCCLVLRNGFTVVGSSACADPANFDEELGKRLAYHDAFNQLWRRHACLELVRQGWSRARPKATVRYSPELQAKVVHYPWLGRSCIVHMIDVVDRVGVGRWPLREWVRRCRGLAT